MKNITFKELEGPAFTGLSCGAMIGAYYTDSLTWTIVGAILGIALYVALHLQDKKKKSDTN